MAPMPATPRRPYTGRRRGRQPGPRSAARASAPRQTTAAAAATAGATSEPPPKRRRYIPGGPGGGGRFVDEDGVVLPPEAQSTAPRPRPSVSRGLSAVSPSVYPRRERSTRMRTAVNRDEVDDVQFSSAAAVAAAVVQSDGYKPREERGWEEFHPNLDIEGTFIVFRAEDVDGTANSTALTPTPAALGTAAPAANGASTPSKDPSAAPTSAPEARTAVAVVVDPSPAILPAVTPPRRRVGRPPRDSYLYFGLRPTDLSGTPRVPQVLPIHNQTPKERLDLKQPTYRKTDRILLFENTQSRYVEKSMMNVGYQESDDYIRPSRNLIKATDLDVDDDLQPPTPSNDDADHVQHGAGPVGRVEYDMDEQDDMWLAALNAQRKAADLGDITREIFEITITKIEKEWHGLEKRIPKPNPKPPQTHRPRSSSAAAVNGEPHAGEEQDSKCAICDDGDCENTNAIVFCDGCDLAVHQECYGVPFIPEGQWLCRKCQLIGRGIPTCIFCPNTDGAFKQTNSSKWAHLLCAMWIPEVSLGNHTFMEPVMDVEKVPKNRWKLTCYICNQRMGACIQCGNKACYQAFHVTCARRARLYLKMKNSQGALAVLDGSMVLKAFCDKHCPQDFAEENSVAAATKEAKKFYRRTMKGRIWADSQASAMAIAASHRHAITERPPDESQLTGAKLDAATGMGENKKGQGQGHGQQGQQQPPQPGSRPPWKLPTGAPVIPQAVYDVVESAMQRFTIRKRRDFVGEACRYWTLKREARRGAALLKRLQLQMETFSSMELTRRNFAAMGPSGKARLSRRLDFAETLVRDLGQLKQLAEDVVRREGERLEEAEIEAEFVDTCYFPIYKLLQPVMEKAYSYDSKDVFQEGFASVQSRLDKRYYTTTLAFAHDLCEAVHVGINTNTTESRAALSSPPSKADTMLQTQTSPSKQGGAAAEAGGRKRLAKRIFQYIKPALLATLRAESDVTNKQLDTLVAELEGMIEASLALRQPSITVSSVDAEASRDVIMVDAPDTGQITVAKGAVDGDGVGVGDAGAEPERQVDVALPMEVDEEQHQHQQGDQEGTDAPVEISTTPSKETVKPNGVPSASVSIAGEADLEAQGEPLALPNGIKPSVTPPASTTNGFPPPSETPRTLPAVQLSTAAPPLTPPQSNGSLSHVQAQEEPVDILSEGGMPWYLKGFELRGTTAVEETWRGRDAVRSLSEELTDMDDDELRGLEFVVDEEAGTIMAMGDDGEEGGETTPGRTRRGKVEALGLGGMEMMTRKTRSGQQLSRARKGLRSSGRRR